VQVTSVIGRHNIGSLEELYGRFTDLGVGEWRLLMLDPIGRMQDPANRELLLDGEELGRLLDFVAAKRRSAGMPVTFEESGFLGLKYEGAVRSYCFHCPAGINIAGLLHDGAISACPSLDRRMVEGDAGKERFSEVWNGRFVRYRDREATRRRGPCSECRWWRHCEGGSLHLWDWDKGPGSAITTC
jgi:radical SAM protein with 4Fe4S-binding SPASM domain